MIINVAKELPKIINFKIAISLHIHKV